ncbi:MAG: succinate dehydrogenase, hydrophobic membrane anchor protein [bacterium JZ-2024 1]
MRNLTPIGATARPEGGFELVAWLFMRVSAVILILMVLVHLWIMHLVTGIENINYEFVVERFRTPFWRFYDWVMLTLALLHGMNGLRYVVTDYVREPGRRAFWVIVIWMLTGIFFLMGTVILFWVPSR